MAAFSAALLTTSCARRAGRAGASATDGELSLSQYHLLEPLIGDERAGASASSRCAAGVSAPTATRMLAGLERDGLVERRTCTRDRRVVHVALTDEGVERMARKRDRIERAPRGALRLARAGRARARRRGCSSGSPPRSRACDERARVRRRTPAATVNPTRTARCSCSRRLPGLRARADDGRPGAARDPAQFGGDPADATWLLTAFLLTAVDRDAAARPPGRHVRQGALAAHLARHLRRRARWSRPSPDRSSVMIAGRAIQGAGGAIFPLAIGIIRDEFPRERVATGDRHDLGDVRHRRRRRARHRRCCSSTRLGVAWIFWLSRGAAAARRAGDLAVRPRVARARARRASTGSAACCSPARCWPLLLAVSEGNAWGWTSAGVLGLFAAAAVLAAIWAAWELRVVDPLVDLRAHAPPPGVDDERRRLRDRLRDVRVVRARSRSSSRRRRACRLRVRRVGDGERALPAAVGAADAVRGPGERTAGRRGTARAAARARARCSRPPATSGSPRLHDARIDIYLGSVLLGLGIGLAFAAMANLVVEAVPMT